MAETDWLADRFEEHRARLRAVAYRMLGSLSEADDAVQDAWVRVNRAGADSVDDIGAWLTTVVARVSLNALRARRVRREEPYSVLPDPLVTAPNDEQPEEQAVMADSVGLALLVVLDTLTPAERLAFVLHDTFQLPFEEIAPLVGRTPAAARQLASRARRRVRGAGVPVPDADSPRQRQVVDAFFEAARGGDFERLMALLDPDIVLRADFGHERRAVPSVTRGRENVAALARRGAVIGGELLPVLVNGSPGVLVIANGKPFAVLGFVIAGGKIVEIDGIGNPERVRRIAAGVLATV